jgi:hypothetical protein
MTSIADGPSPFQAILPIRIIIPSMVRGYTLERTVNFLSEETTELYIKYSEEVPQLKKLLGAKNALQRRALPALERRGV